jgi:spermidine/putrescine transport system permease protein
MKNKKPVFLPIYTALFFLYIFIPIILIFIFAWNSGEGYSFPLEGFTWRWFTEMLGDQIARKAIGNSTIIAFSSATISTVLAVFLSIGILKGLTGKIGIFLVLLILPVLMPSLTIGISSLVFFRTINIPLGIPIVILSHVSVSMSYVFLILMGRIEELPLSLQEASIDLGAGWFSSVRDIMIPNLMPAAVAGWLFAFMISWNEFIITYFLVGNNLTLPVYIFSQLRFGISPKVNVIAVLITLFTLFMIAVFLLSRRLYGKILMRMGR